MQTTYGSASFARLVVGMVAVFPACAKVVDTPVSTNPAARSITSPETAPASDEYLMQREKMVSAQLAGRDIVDPRVLDAMRRVPRHQFVPAAQRDRAYDDHPLPIGQHQTISQPYIVALMTQLVEPEPTKKGARCWHRIGVPGGCSGRACRRSLQHRDCRGFSQPSPPKAGRF